MVQFLDATSACGDAAVAQVVALLKTVVTWLQIIIPVALILWGTIDMGKAVIAGDEKKIKEAQKPFIKRLISAVIVFLIPFILNLVIGLVATGGTTNSWSDCWNAVEDFEKIDLDEKKQNK